MNVIVLHRGVKSSSRKISGVGGGIKGGWLLGDVGAM